MKINDNAFVIVNSEGKVLGKNHSGKRSFGENLKTATYFLRKKNAESTISEIESFQYRFKELKDRKSLRVQQVKLTLEFIGEREV